MFNLDGNYISQFMYFNGNNFYCVINCLNMNRVTISRIKYLDIVTSNVLSTSYFRYNSQEKEHKISQSENEATQNW